MPIRDLAGEVIAIGEGVQGFAVGDEVIGWLQDSLARVPLVTVPVAQLIRKPAGLPWDVAGSLYVTPLAGFASVKAVEPQAGQVVVVAGASGGGLVAAQLTKRTGATVIGLTSQYNGGIHRRIRLGLR